MASLQNHIRITSYNHIRKTQFIIIQLKVDFLLKKKNKYVHDAECERKVETKVLILVNWFF